MTSRNFPGEQQRVEWSVQSVLNQECNAHQLLFLDLSPIDHRFILPQHKRLQVFTWENCSLKDNWYMCYLRNWLALRATTKYIVHVNADVIYDPQTAATILKRITEKGDSTLLQCRRCKSSQKQYGGLRSFKDVMTLWKTCKKKDSHQACGELQGMSREAFIEMGGYHGLIKDGKIQQPFNIKQGRHEDTYLWRQQLKYTVWIDDTIHIMHMWHPPRPAVKKWARTLNLKNWHNVESYMAMDYGDEL